jgi:hypothetical protein
MTSRFNLCDVYEIKYKDSGVSFLYRDVQVSGLPHCPAAVQVTLSLLKLHLALSESDYIHTA